MLDARIAHGTAVAYIYALCDVNTSARDSTHKRYERLEASEAAGDFVTSLDKVLNECVMTTHT